MGFDDLLLYVVDKEASDLHITVGLPPMVRVDGRLKKFGDEKVSGEVLEGYCKKIMSDEQFAILNEKGEIDLAYSIPSRGRFRVNAFKQRGAYAIVARVVNLTIPSPEELGLPSALMEMCDKKRGLVLVTGATGSGKSTTLASMIDQINKTYDYHVITLEDPIEYLHRHNRSVVNQRELGVDTKSFTAALRGALRQDPDVILVGEMRDLDTIATAITAAETGHLVLSTLHTTGAANTIDRIIDVFPADQQDQIRTQLADVLQCVVSQQLLPKIGGGRVGAFELMISNPAIKNNIREGKTFQIPSVMQTNLRMGMKTMDDALLELFLKRQITREEALTHAQDREALEKRIAF